MYYNAIKAREDLSCYPMIQWKRNFYWEVVGMDANTILKIKPELTRLRHQFDACFGRGEGELRSERASGLRRAVVLQPSRR